MRVLLIQVPEYYYRAYTFPLGLGYIAKAAWKSGHDVEVLDIWAHEYTEEEVVERVKQLDYDIVGISALSAQYAYVKWLASELKRCHGKKIVVGGALAIFSPEIVLRNTEADICVTGEGEITFTEILANLDNLEGVKGIYFKQGDKIVKNPPREHIQNLDDVEFPAWDLFPIDTYIENTSLAGYPNIKTIAVMSSRGCPYSCRFCSRTFTGVRFRSVDNIVAEIKEFTMKYPQVKGIDFVDDLLTIDKRRMYELCDAIEPLSMKWGSEARVDRVDFELLKRMKRAGCAVLSYGIESGSQSILDRMNKKATVEQAENAVRDTIRAGILTRIHMMYGYPGETRGTLRETIDFFNRLPYLSVQSVSMLGFSRAKPLPGAELYDQALKEGLIQNEEEYLENLTPYKVCGVIKTLTGMNLTEFSEEEFHQLKRKTEREIFWGNIRRHPFRFAIDYPSYLFRVIAAGVIRGVPYLKRHGLKQTIQEFVRIALIRRV